MNTDRIERKIELEAPVSRVWRALTDHAEFGRWFGIEADGPFVPGRPSQGRKTSPGCSPDSRWDAVIRKIEPETLFSYTWHPYSEQPVDPAQEPSTLVEFRLAPTPKGTLLTVTESGFDQLPPHRRDPAFRKHSEGWTMQVDNLSRHVAQA